VGAAHQDIASFEKAIDANDPDDRTVDALRVRRAARRHSVREWRTKSHGRHPGAARIRGSQQDPHQRQGLQDGPDAAQDGAGADVQGAHVGRRGWYSTNILGNRDGEVLDDPESFKTKEESKLGVLEHILEPDRYPELYGDIYHKVRINYYPPRGDNKEGWDNIDIFGWMNYPMQIKVDFLVPRLDSGRAACPRLALFSDLASRAGMGGIQEWLSFYYKSPQVAPGLYPEHDLFIQLTKLKNTLRWMMGEDMITHLGLEYYPTTT
jgi:myo-inositol-1-phosphate synthase